MTNDTKAIIATILATGLGVSGLLGTLLGNRIANVEAEVRSIRTEVQAVRTDLGAEVQALRTDLRTEVQALRTELGGRIDRLRDEMLENSHRLDERMRAIEQAFARIDQRLDMLERAVIPSAEPAE